MPAAAPLDIAEYEWMTSARDAVPRALLFDPQAVVRLHSIESEHAVEREVHANRGNTD